MQFKGIYLVAQNGRANQKFVFINAIAISLFSLQVSLARNPAIYFHMRKNDKHIYHSLPHFPVITVTF